MLLNKIKNKIHYIIIFIGLIYSIFNSISDTQKYDKYNLNQDGEEFHHILKGDISHYWEEAHLFKKYIEEGKSFIHSGGERERSYLYPKIIAIYYLIIDKNIINKNGKFEINNYKFGIPIIQTVIFYFALVLFYIKLSKIFSYQVLFFAIFFLALEPSLMQFHSSYWTESLYLSMLLLLFSFLLNPPKKNYGYFFLGILLGVIYLQRSISLFLLLPAIIYLIIVLKYQAIKPCLSIILGYSLIILLLGFQNYKRSGVFYITSSAYLDAPWHYLAHKLNSNKLGITEEQALKKKYEDMNKWINENEININIYSGNRKLHQYKKNYFLKSLKNNYFYFAKYHIYKSMQTMIFPLNNNESYYKKKPDEKVLQNQEQNSKIKYKITYSLFIYVISLIGLINMMLYGKKYERSLIILIFLLCVYHLGMTGWAGNNRYGVPNQIFYSIIFGFGAEWIYKKIKYLKINFR